ncbi:3-hydroxybutyrate dehydrogenase [Allofrancisella guangzhouensis]|uniref:Short-chain dehydrogenase n=1 Tax=Allofrancisella guangzhouensis TaxID=594679 RepID=A0A0A8EA92_9GAMM|nr:3-hydroxybutyrate dehydrogenase [Allofrancisella guangzhouensis]AJC49061.1 short-chain dehydrogenase [Allofrancisella guangzhouensis]MBK2026653.1 3-hydroxybutyrate dehydrogenase [Allofrancisella guangzhouensis]MBK2043866.1 3-hydroxybutyrate dehydrogenase [Allofrancisella guangzhouensis]MBK2046288.1 3-hydroxybutyrate dehydrogenase [Allofrancisella guangzhouensis]
MSVKNKVVLITGAASGLGLGMAKEFAKQEAKVVIADLDLQKSQDVAKELAQQNHVDTLAVEMDVTSQEQVKKGIYQIIDKFGRIDTVINNAGIQIISPIVDFDVSAWKKIFEIHMTGTLLVTQEAMRHMIKLKTGGRVIVIGSIHSVLASKNKAAYVAAKHAQLGFVRALAKEGAEHNISSNLIAPGFVLTPLVEKQIPEQAKELNISEEEVIKNIMLGNTVDGEFTTVQDIADTAIFLAGFKTNALTGQKILVSHGAGM